MDLVSKLFNHNFGRIRRLLGDRYASGSFLDPTNDGLAVKACCEPDDGRNRNARFNLETYKAEIEESFDVTDVKPLATGGFGLIYVGRHCHKDGEQKEIETKYALKVIQATHISDGRREIWQRNARSEVYFHKHLGEHENVVNFYGEKFLSINQEGTKGYLVIKNECLLMNLDEMLKDLTTLKKDQWIRLARHIGSALEWMHDKQIAHHDIKGLNMMISADGTWKILDFGYTKKYKCAKYEAIELLFRKGTEFYLSPQKKTFATITMYNPFKADAFAFGLTLLEAIFGKDRLREMRNKNNDSVEQACKIFSQGKDLSKYFKAVLKLVTDLEWERFFVDEAMKEFRS